MGKKSFDKFTYGVGLEITAESFKQVKKELKGHFDTLEALVKQFEKEVKINPKANLSDLFKEMREIKSITDGISGSKNSFADFVDKGTLDRIANLEKALTSIVGTTDKMDANLAKARTQLNGVTKSLKEAGNIKFPATYATKFNQTKEIKQAKDDIDLLTTTLDKLQAKLKTSKKDPGKLLPEELDTKSLTTWVKRYNEAYQRVQQINNNKTDISFTKEMTDQLIRDVNTLSTLGPKLGKAVGMLDDDLLKDIYRKFNIKPVHFENSLNVIPQQIQSVIDQVKVKKDSLSQQFDDLQAKQKQFLAKTKSLASGGRSLGLVNKDENGKELQRMQVKVDPKVNAVDWANKINSVLRDIEAKLDPVVLKPTFANSSKNLKKDINGNLAKINHEINVSLKVNDNIKKFEEDIDRIDGKIKSQKERLEKHGNFKVRFNYEEGGRFKDAVYDVINKLKNITATFYISNGKKFINDLSGIRTKATSKLKDIPIGLDDKTFLSKVDSIYNETIKKIGNIVVNLKIGNRDEFLSSIPNNVQSYNNTSVMNNSGQNNVITEEENNTQRKIQALEQSLHSLRTDRINSKEFLKLGEFDKELNNNVKIYNDLVNKLSVDKETLRKTYGSYELYEKDLSKYEDLNVRLNAIVDDAIRTYESEITNLRNKFKADTTETLIKQDVNKQVAKDVKDNNIVNTSNVNTSGIKKTTAEVDKLSDKAKEAKDDIHKIGNEINALNRSGLNSKYFLKSGTAYEDKKLFGEDVLKDLKERLKQYKAADDRLRKSKHDFKSVYGFGNEESKAAYKADLDMIAKNKPILDEALQKKLQYLEQKKLNIKNNVLDKEKQISKEKRAQLELERKELMQTISKRQEIYNDLKKNGRDSKWFTALGKWDSKSNSFTKDSEYMQNLLNNYNAERNARLAAGLDKNNRSKNERSYLGEINGALRSQKSHIEQIISADVTRANELNKILGIEEQITFEGKAQSQVKTKDISELQTKLAAANKAKAVLENAKKDKNTYDFNALAQTGIGDRNNVVGAAGYKGNLKDYVDWYYKLIGRQQELNQKINSMSTEGRKFNSTEELNKFVQEKQQYQNELNNLLSQTKDMKNSLKQVYRDQLGYTKGQIKSYNQQIAAEKQILNTKQQQTQEEQKQATQSSNITNLEKEKQIETDILNKKQQQTQEEQKQIVNSSKRTTSQKPANTQTAAVGKQQTVQLDNTTLGSLAKENTLSAISGKIDNIIAALNNKGNGVKSNSDKPSTSSGGQKKDNSTKQGSSSKGNKSNKDASKAYDGLFKNLVDSRAKEIELGHKIKHSNTSTKNAEEELRVQQEISRSLESQLKSYGNVYNYQSNLKAWSEARAKSEQSIAGSVSKQADKNINAQNKEIDKIVKKAQDKYNKMSYVDPNKPMMANLSGDALNTLNQYNALLEKLKATQAKIKSDPNWLNNEKNAQAFSSLLMQMDSVEKEFNSLKSASDKFFANVKNKSDIKVLDSSFDPKNLTAMHSAMREFANQASVGGAQLIKFDDANRTATFSIQNGKNEVQKLKVAYDAATNSLGRYITETKTMQTSSQKFFSNIKRGFAHVTQYLTSFGSIYRIFAEIRRGFTYVKEIDVALTELKKVTNETDATYDKFLETMSRTAGVVGSTTSELTTMAAEWSRLGYSIEESAKLAESTAILLNVSEFKDATAASEALISTMQAFGYVADDSQHVVDILNEVGNNYAVSSDGIATALMDSASALMEGGNNLEQATALVAAANRVVQDPNSVGSALRTISLRLRGTSVEVLEEMGEETEGAVESFSKMQSKIKALSGIDIVDMNGAYKDTYTILKEIGTVWGDMADMDQAALLELMAGKNRANTLAAILDNMEDLEGAYETAMNAEGSAIRENEAYLDSIQGKIDLFTNSLQTMWSSTLDSDIVKGFVELGTTLLDLVTKFGLVETSVVAFAAGWMLIKKQNPVLLFKDLSAQMYNYGLAMEKVKSLKALSVGTNTFDTNSVNAYAAAVSNLTAKQQASLLASQGLTREQIKEVLIKNQVSEATMEEALAQSTVVTAKQRAVSVTAGNVEALMAENGITLTSVASDYLKQHSTQEVTLEMLKEALAAEALTKEEYEAIAATLGLVGANKGLTLSFKGLGAAIKTALLTNPIGLALTAITTIATIGIPLFKELTDAQEEANEAAEETITTYESAQEELSSMKSTIDGLVDDFKRLSSGVGDQGENLSLTTDSYARYNEIANQIADLFPEMVTGWTEEGNAILSCKGNVDALTEAYEAQAQAARQAIIAGGSDVFDAFKMNYNNNPDFTFGTKTGLKQQVKLAERLKELMTDATEEEVKSFFTDLNAGNIEIDGEKYSNIEMSDLFDSTGIKKSDFYNWFKDDYDMDAFKNHLGNINTFITSSKNKIKSEALSVISVLNAYLGEDSDYKALDKKYQNLISGFVSNLDSEFLNGFDSQVDIYAWIKTNYIEPFSDPSIKKSIEDLLDVKAKLDIGEIISYGEYKKEVEAAVEGLQGKLDEDAISQIKLSLGIDEESFTQSYNHIESLLSDKFKKELGQQGSSTEEFIKSLSLEDFNIAGSLEVDPGTIESYKELKQAIKEAKYEATEDFDLTNYTSAVAAMHESIAVYEDALRKIKDGSFTIEDFMELIKDFPELAEGVDLASGSFEGLSENLIRAIESSPDDLIDELKELKYNLEQVGKSTDGIDGLIYSLEQMPTNIVEDLSVEFGTLADQMDRAAKSKNNLDMAMEEESTGYDSRSEAMEMMVDWMEKGEIGSESQLWDVAKANGFSYDSAKTINENADALMNYINVRKKWYDQDDDGNYTYAAIEDFMESIESAAGSDAFKKAMEKQGLEASDFKWSYDEDTGAFNVDFDNINWETIVKCLSETSEAAGLTSEEFYDLYSQAGKYFGIEWEDFDDQLNHLNSIANSADDAKTKISEYGKAMQDYFGKDTNIDLTDRPVVNSEKMKKAGWEIEDGSYATVDTSSYSNEDGTKTVVLTPILPDGTVLSPDELKSYADKILAGEEIDPDIKIKLAEFEGKDSVDQADKYAQKLHSVQEQYYELLDPLKVANTLQEEGLDGLNKIEKVSNSLKKDADGNIVGIDEQKLRKTLEAANYTEDAIESTIDMMKAYNAEVFNIDKFDLFDDDGSIDKGLDSLKEIKELKDSIYENKETGQTVVDIDQFSAVLQEAGYTKDEIDELISKVKEYQEVITIKGSTDPLGLSSDNLNINDATAALDALGIKYIETVGKLGDGKMQVNIDVADMYTTLSNKGWSKEKIVSYIQDLAGAEGDGVSFVVNGKTEISTEEIDAAIEKSKEIPEKEQTKYEVTGGGIKTLKDIDTYWNNIPKSKTTNYTIKKTTIEETKKKSSFWSNLFSDDDGSVANGTANFSGIAHANGNWGAPRTETALTGELGPEMIVRGNRWFTVGDNGAEFANIQKGDIIFNHKQTEELLKNGHITSRGKIQGQSAFASGTAYVNTNGKHVTYSVNSSGKLVKDSYSTTKSKNKKKNSKDSKDEFEEVFDWFEVKIEEINEDLDLMAAKLENAVTIKGKNNILNDMIATNKSELKTLEKGYKLYDKYANDILKEKKKNKDGSYSYIIPKKYWDKLSNEARDGKIAIEEFYGEVDEKTLEQIKNYREWTQKAAALKKNIQEVRREITELAKQKFDNISEKYDNIEGLQDSRQQHYVDMADYREDKGWINSDKYYKAAMSEEKKKMQSNKNEKKRLQASLDNSVKKGHIKKYSAEWYEMVNAIHAVDSAIDENKANIEDYQNRANEVHFENFEKGLFRVSRLADETQSLIDLMSDADDFDVSPEGDVKWTDEGITKMGLYAQNMENYKKQNELYAEEIDHVNQMYKDGKISYQEYIEKLDDLKKGQADSVKGYKDNKAAIVDMQKARVDAIKEGIDKEIEAYSELIDKKKEELSSEKDLYDFQKSVIEQKKSVSDLDRQIAALAGDNSASANAKRKKLEAERAQAQQELQDSYYNRSVEKQQEALDAEFEQFEELREKEKEGWDKWLENTDAVFKDAIGIVTTSGKTIKSTLGEIAKDWDLQINTHIKSPWNDATTALSSTSLALDGVIEKFQTAATEADKTAQKEIDKQKDQNQDITDEVKDKFTKGQKVSANKGTQVYKSDGTKWFTTDYDANYTVVSVDNNTGLTKVKNSDGKIRYIKTNDLSSKNVDYYKKYTGKSTSLVDALKAVEAPSSLANRKKIAEANNINNYKGTKDQNKKLLSLLKNGKLKKFAKGSKSIDSDQLAWLDELGEELQIVPNGSGRLDYVKKGTGIIPADMTERLMNLAMNPQDMLDSNRPSVGVSPEVHNTEINLNIQYGDMLKIENFKGDNPDEIAKIVAKQFEKHTKDLNNALRKYVR